GPVFVRPRTRRLALGFGRALRAVGPLVLLRGARVRGPDDGAEPFHLCACSLEERSQLFLVDAVLSGDAYVGEEELPVGLEGEQPLLRVLPELGHVRAVGGDRRLGAARIGRQLREIRFRLGERITGSGCRNRKRGGKGTADAQDDARFHAFSIGRRDRIAYRRRVTRSKNAVKTRGLLWRQRGRGERWPSCS